MRTLLLLVLCLAAVACRAEERVLVFSSAMGTVGLADEIRRVIEPHLRGGWTVKHVATGSNLVVFVLEEPKEKPVVEAGPRRPVPGGLEERRAKMLATKPEGGPTP